MSRFSSDPDKLRTGQTKVISGKTVRKLAPNQFEIYSPSTGETKVVSRTTARSRVGHRHDDD